MSEISQDRAIGRLEGKIDTLITAQVAADASRSQTNSKLDSISRQQDATKRDVETIVKRLEAVEAPVAEMWKWRERIIGAVMLVGLISAAIGAAITWVWNKLLAMFTS